MVGVEVKSSPVVNPTFCVNCDSKRIDPTNLNGDPMTIGRGSSSEVGVYYPVNKKCPYALSVAYHIDPVPEGWNPLFVYRINWPR
jgi:hypothetical protein